MFQTRVCALSITVMVGFLAAMPAQSAEYVVDGFKVGDLVAPDTPNYRSYVCKPSTVFAAATECDRTQQMSSRGGSAATSNTLIHAVDGKVLLTMASARASALSRSSTQGEVDALSRAIGARPTNTEWKQGDNGTPSILIVTWGQVKLEEVVGEDLEDLAGGKDPHLGVLVDTVGDVKLSTDKDYPVYRVTGGPGFVYVAGIEANGHGNRRTVAIDPPQLAIKQFQLMLEAILQKDQTLAKDDYQLWPEVARITRRLALDTSQKIADSTLDKVFDGFPSKKLRSHVWSLLPTGAIIRLATSTYSRLDVYGPKTEHPEIRSAIKSFLAANPSEPFIEFAHFVIGDFDKALAVNPNSVIADVLNYAIGYKIMGSLLQDTIKTVAPRATQLASLDAKNELKSLLDDNPDDPYYLDNSLRVSNQNPALYDPGPLSSVVQNFVPRATAAKPFFEAVTRRPSSVLADDAAYMLAWLAINQGQATEAMAYLSQGMLIGNGDYTPAATAQAVRLVKRYSPREQYQLVESHDGFTKQPALWYVAARSAYRDFDYALAIEVAQHGLKALNVDVDGLPATTDPQKIEAALEKVSSDLGEDPNAVELPYLIQAAKEISGYLASLNSAATERPDILTKRSRAIIFKYSKLVDAPVQAGGDKVPPLAHRDLRQALHMIDQTLSVVPRDEAHSALREWLYYRKVRILAVYQPSATGSAVAEMEQEYPNSRLMDDALAEEIFAEGVMLRDLKAAQKTFRKLITTFPNGNAVDNSYSWMAIILRCEGHTEEEQSMNREIIRRFPLTRHARYARERIAKPTECGLNNE
jgi:tetratricopeptide (TPR) repeat protein